jgi:CxxC motif-containing protein
MKKKMTCIECPRGCALEAELGSGGKVLSVAGHQCPRGEKYARQEIEAPMRTLTTCVLARGLELPMLPVRTSAPIPKEKLAAAMDEVRRISVTSPVRCGDVVAADFLGPGADLVATRDLGPAGPSN